MKKVAICMLTTHTPTKPKIWERFLQDGRFSLYIHNKHEIDWGANYCIPNIVDTERSNISIVKATDNIIKRAIKDTAVELLIVVSGDTIPITSPGNIYKKLIVEQQNIQNNFKHYTRDWTEFFNGPCEAIGEKKKSTRYQGIRDKDAIPYDKYTCHPQWVSLNRETAEFIVNNNYYDEWGSGMPHYFPDESYYGTVCKINDIPINDYQLTYDNWTWSELPKYIACSPHTYVGGEITDEHIHNIKSRGFMFMRKIHPDAQVPDNIHTI